MTKRFHIINNQPYDQGRHGNMTKTITGTTTLEVTLTAATTIIDGTIATYGYAIYGSAPRNWSLTNNGVVYSSDGTGIFITGGAVITNATHASIRGDSTGIDVEGVATIRNAGTIDAAGNYSFGIFLQSGGAITNAASGVISGARGVAGFDDNGNAFTMLNQGLISGTEIYGVVTDGTVTNAKSGTIIGPTGMELFGGTIINAGLIEGTSGAAIAFGGVAYGDIIEQKSGTIIGGIANFLGGDTIDDAGITITSESFADNTLTLFDGTAQIGTLGLPGDFTQGEFKLKSDGDGGTDILLGAATFTGTYTDGVTLTALTSTVAATADITGYNGIDARFYRAFTLVNHGTITGTGTGAFSEGVIFDTGGEISNTGLIEGASGIYAYGGTIVNAGTIAGTTGPAIALSRRPRAADIILKSGSVLRGSIYGFETGDTIDLAGITATGKIFENGVLTLTNAGAVVDTIALDGVFNSAAFKLDKAPAGGTDITIAPTETFSGHYNSGLVLSSLYTSITSKASFSYLKAFYGRNWTVVNSGTVSDPFYAYGAAVEAGQFTNTSTGLIIGNIGVGYGFTGPGITNAGTIIGKNAEYGAGVSMDAGGSLTNLKTGTIIGSVVGVSQFYATLINDGVITGPIGLNMQGGTAHNAGLITAASGPAAYTYRDAGLILDRGTFANAAAGTIAGPTGATITFGTLYNAGHIEGLPGGFHGTISVASAGLDITDGTDAGTVTNAAGGLISGDVGILLHEGTFINAGTIASTQATSGIALSFASTFTARYAYAALILDKGNVIDGAIAGFSSGDIIDFAATTLTADTFANHILTLKDGASTVEKLTLTGTFQQSEFILASDGSRGTELFVNITTAASPAMAFLRPSGWTPSLTPETLYHPPSPAALPTTTQPPAPTLTAWFNLQQPHPDPVPAVTLRPG